MKLKNLFVFGCSFTKDNYQDTWANLVAYDHSLTLHNCAERGAGADFLINRLLTTNIDPTNSLVMIMWPSADRFDLWVDSTTPHLQADVGSASWVDGRQAKFVDHYGNHNTEVGFNLNGSIPRGYKHHYYKFLYTPTQAIHNWYVNIITAQLYLKSKNLKTIMTSAFPINNPIHYHDDKFIVIPEIFNQIDQTMFDNCSQNEGFFNYCKNRNLPFLNSHYPTTQSHRHFVDNVLQSIITNIMKD